MHAPGFTGLAPQWQRARASFDRGSLVVGQNIVRHQNWASGMPTNALLVSGPSKTADIEQTLAYGVHGPKELIILVIE